MPRALWVARPALDLWRGLERCLEGGGPAFFRVALGLAIGWWLYVPLHELLHAAGCLATGGQVWRLEIAPLYGGSLLARWLPFVVAEGEYAGRLAGFATGGSDLAYAATVAAPYLLTVFPGVWALRRCAARPRALGFGLALPVAAAPFLALGGDAYELGALLVTRLPPWTAAAARLRGDDLLLRAAELAADAAGPITWAGFALAALLGLAASLALYALAGAVAERLGEPPLPPGKMSSASDGER